MRDVSGEVKKTSGSHTSQKKKKKNKKKDYILILENTKKTKHTITEQLNNHKTMIP